MVRVLFCFYPLYVKYNHGIALLSALCKERGIETDLYILDDVDHFGEHLHKNDYDYISFSCVTVHDYKKCLPFIVEAKIRAYKVLLGGVYIRRGTPIDAPVDYLCRGEGETLPDFILSGDDRLFRERMLCNDLNALSLPDYDLFRNISFKRSHLLQGYYVLPYYSSRGCPYRCPFCEVSLQSEGVRFRYKIKEDLTYLLRIYSPDIFFIGDELLPYYNEMWRDSWGDFRHPFFGYIRADISKEQLEWLINRGLVACAFGVESGDEKYRNEVLGKRLKDIDIFRTVEILNRRNIKYVPFFMTDTPKETFIIRAKTHRMAKEIGGYPFMWKYENLGGEIWLQQQY